MYEIFVLGELMEMDKHGYLLQERLKRAVGPIRQISSGTLYPLISRLVSQEWISLIGDDTATGKRPKKKYTLTVAGKREFMELMKEPLKYNTDIEIILHFKMCYFEYVSKQVQLSCLEQYYNYLKYNLDYIQDQIQLFMDKKHQIPEQKRMQVMRMLEHRKFICISDVEWVTNETAKIQTSPDKETE
ncbi:PadR family transcriptional regulator [Shimazuella kribbensis]|uniref:PadR family transcriptional regulator n=1 Tax=Shimazuella kribbensis TaxID=139808 RepID=UPI00040EB5B8|nr:PadR family transcriptional regulator [Shimazuella kribbensis]